MNKKEDISWIKITDEFKWIISEINTSNDNFFIVGKAGTGKSTLLKLLHSTTLLYVKLCNINCHKICKHQQKKVKKNDVNSM